MTVTKTVFIGAVAIVATAFHGCGNKEEENQNSDETQSTETDEQEQVLKARQRDTENAVRITLNQAQEIQDLKAKNQALKEAAKACRADGNCCAGNAGCNDVPEDEMRAAFEKIQQEFLKNHHVDSLDKLTEDQMDELSAILDEQMDEFKMDDFGNAKDMLEDRLSPQTVKMLEQKVEKLRAVEGDTAAERAMNTILGEYAKKYGLEEDAIDELQDLLTEEHALEIAQKLEKHTLDFKPVLEKNVKAQKVAKAQKASEKFDKMMATKELEEENLKDLAGEMAEDSMDFEAVAAFKAQAAEVDGPKKELLNKLAILVQQQGFDEEEVQAEIEQFKADAASQFGGKAFDDLNLAEIKKLINEIDTDQKMMEHMNVADDDARTDEEREQAQNALHELQKKRFAAMSKEAENNPKLREALEEYDPDNSAAGKAANRAAEAKTIAEAKKHEASATSASPKKDKSTRRGSASASGRGSMTV